MSSKVSNLIAGQLPNIDLYILLEMKRRQQLAAALLSAPVSYSSIESLMASQICAPTLQQLQPVSNVTLFKSTTDQAQQPQPSQIPHKTVTQQSSRYKSELCRSFAETGNCKYGSKCQFAHGSQELRTLLRHPKYKSELCKTYHTTGFCPYGPRCHFVHDEDEMKIREIRTQQQLHLLQQQHLQARNIQTPLAAAEVTAAPNNLRLHMNSPLGSVGSSCDSARSSLSGSPLALSPTSSAGEDPFLPTNNSTAWNPSDIAKNLFGRAQQCYESSQTVSENANINVLENAVKELSLRNKMNGDEPPSGRPIRARQTVNYETPECNPGLRLPVFAQFAQ